MVPFLHFESFERGTAIIEESSEGNALYVITEGSVEVVKMLPKGPGGELRIAKLAELGQGDSFGEMELLDTMERSASVIAKDKTQCLVLTTGTFLKLYDVRPEAYRIITLNLARELSRRLRIADIRIAELEEQLVQRREDLREREKRRRQESAPPPRFKAVW